MGLDINGTSFLLYARKRGVSFEKTATIGRQSMLVDAAGLKKNLERFGLNLASPEIEEIVTGAGGYAEAFLELLGARETVSFDASAYENATCIHDFNDPIDDKFKNRFSTVLDGGTLEHIFNYPQALKNCMEMVQLGGHFLAITPANNYLGHGFYQFSPELFFRVFSKANGFSLEQLLIYEETKNYDWYAVTDPDAVKERVILVNEEPSMLLVIAKKHAAKELFAVPPQQSDFLAAWNAHDQGFGRDQRLEADPMRLSGLPRLGFGAWKRIQRNVNRFSGMLNRRRNHFKKIDPFDG